MGISQKQFWVGLSVYYMKTRVLRYVVFADSGDIRIRGSNGSPKRGVLLLRCRERQPVT